jgi:photosystem II stability/assembly factor-like uncharacterized protein
MAHTTLHSSIRRRGAFLATIVLAAGMLLPTGATHAAAATPLNLTSVHFVSSTIGWGMTGAALLRTVDGGATWQAVTPHGLKVSPPFPPAATYFDATHAWITDGAQGETPGIFRTADGGHTWKHATLPAPAQSAGPIDISQIDFVDATHGWTLEDLGGGAGTFYFRLLRSTDGGAHWSQIAGGIQPPPTAGAYPTNVQGITFDSATSGWTSVVVFAGPQQSGLYHSTDAGRTWRKANLPMTGVFSDGFFGVQTPIFFDSRHAVTFISNQTAIGIYVTGDGGATWTPSTPLVVKPILSAAAPFATDVVDPQHTWLIVGSHFFFFSADLGRHWSLVRQSLGFDQIGALDYINAQTGWALGGTQADNGTVHTALRRTTDGGHTWQVLHPALL